MTKETILRNAALEVQIKSQRITSRRIPEETKAEYDRAAGYVCALYDAKVFDRDMYQAAMDLLKAAYHAAQQMADKKTAPGAANTESGSKGGHPQKDDSFTHNFSIDSIFIIVKRGGERV